jgi:hypothetical protein
MVVGVGMGTNFYLREASRTCPTCGHDSAERLHIGKSSMGWCFSLHVMPERGINDLDDWLPLLRDPANRIVDEYGDAIAADELIRRITEREQSVVKTPFGYPSWSAFHASNSSVPGPSGLVRHRLDDCHCVKHGAGTWDCITGEFS